MNIWKIQIGECEVNCKLFYIKINPCQLLSSRKGERYLKNFSSVRLNFNYAIVFIAAELIN